ncbi:hypothetical protein Hanom_Chr14g01317561 [Helianthus anomalus]
MSIYPVNNGGSLQPIDASRNSKHCILSHLWRQNSPPFSTREMCCTGNPSSHAQFPLVPINSQRKKHHLKGL